MAAAAERSGRLGIFWMKNVPNEDQPLAFVPGVDGRGKIRTPIISGRGNSSSLNRRGSNMSLKRVCASRNVSNLKTNGKAHFYHNNDRSEAFTLEKCTPPDKGAMTSQPANTVVPLSEVMSRTCRDQRDVSLKDLCSKDKRRIANLVEELARVSEEKEEFLERLKNEQGSFERKIQQLEQQNLVIAHERESLQQQYRECQELLSLYQQYLSQQQSKLNQSITQLSQPATYSTVLCSKEVPSRTITSQANGLLFDGSYISLPACGGQQSLVHRNGEEWRTAQNNVRTPPACSSVFEPSPTDGLIKQQHVGEKKLCRECHRCEKSKDMVQNPKEHMCYSGQHRSCETLCNHLNNQERSKSTGNAQCSEAKEVRTHPMLGQEDWEEKKHQLLLQKMQLEMERERLHARLAEQEERISRQTQQLQQSGLYHSSALSETEYRSSKTRIGGTEPDSPSQEDLPPSRYKDGAVHPAGQSGGENYTKTGPASPNNTKDDLKSPAKPSDRQARLSLCSTQKTTKTSIPRFLSLLLADGQETI